MVLLKLDNGKELHVGLGRLVRPDPRDKLYQMADVLAKKPAKELAVLPDYRYYHLGPTLNQGATNKCTAFAWRQWMSSAPIMDRASFGPDPDIIYDAEQRIDGFPIPHDGSTVRAGAEVMRQEGLMKNYVWAYDVDTIIKWILTESTVVCGTDWYDSMFTPDEHGYVEPSGSIEGGHAYLMYGYSAKHKAFAFINSWGNDWGRNGKFFMKQDVFMGLLKAEGEACAASEKKVTPRKLDTAA